MKKSIAYYAGFYGANITYTTVALAVVFTVLRLTGVIAWSWWWVFAPVWMPFSVTVLLVVVAYALLRKYGK